MYRPNANGSSPNLIVEVIGVVVAAVVVVVAAFIDIGDAAA